MYDFTRERRARPYWLPFAAWALCIPLLFLSLYLQYVGKDVYNYGQLVLGTAIAWAVMALTGLLPSVLTLWFWVIPSEGRRWIDQFPRCNWQLFAFFSVFMLAVGLYFACESVEGAQDVASGPSYVEGTISMVIPRGSDDPHTFGLQSDSHEYREPGGTRILRDRQIRVGDRIGVQCGPRSGVVTQVEMLTRTIP